jgi:hypothetical protein
MAALNKKNAEPYTQTGSALPQAKKTAEPQKQTRFGQSTPYDINPS